MALQLVQSNNLSYGGFVFRGDTREIEDLRANTLPMSDIRSSDIGICFRQITQSGTAAVVGYIAECSISEQVCLAVGEPSEALAEEALNELHQVVLTIQQGHLLPEGGHGFEDLLTQAVARRGRPADVASWARRLAEDVGDLTD